MSLPWPPAEVYSISKYGLDMMEIVEIDDFEVRWEVQKETDELEVGGVFNEGLGSGVLQE